MSAIIVSCLLFSWDFRADLAASTTTPAVVHPIEEKNICGYPAALTLERTCWLVSNPAALPLRDPAACPLSDPAAITPLAAVCPLEGGERIFRASPVALTGECSSWLASALAVPSLWNLERYPLPDPVAIASDIGALEEGEGTLRGPPVLLTP